MLFFLAIAAAAGPDEESVRDAMDSHWDVGVALRDAVIRGSLADVHAQASAWLKQPTPAEPLLLDAHARLLGPFTRLQAAPDLAEAADGVAQLAATCGDCHHQHERTRSWLPPKPPSADSMDKHRAGTEWMWAGLVTQSDELFQIGVRTLRGSDTPPGTKRANLQFDRKVRKLAKKAADSTDIATRVTTYGMLLSSCADCHKASPPHREPALPTEVLATEMHDRFWLLTDARDALRTSDTKKVQRIAAELVQLAPPSTPDAWRPWIADVKSRAAQLTRTEDPKHAAELLAEIAASCGACHASVGGGPSVPTEDALDDTISGIDLLWLSLLTESDDAWRFGVNALKIPAYSDTAAPERPAAFAHILRTTQ